MRTGITSTLVMVALLGLIGCGGDEAADTKPASGDSTQAATPITPPAETTLTGCGWITEADASTALGKPMKYRSNDPGSSNCIVDEAAGEGGISADFSVREGSGFYDLNAKQVRVEMLSGLGDRAVWNPGEMISTLVTVKGNRELQITLSDPTRKNTDMKEKAMALAKVIVDKMNTPQL
jgi:hypothetical protein